MSRSAPVPTDPAAPVLSIGAVAGQTQLSIATLRAWERRYGFPVPERVPSGHRRYTSQQVEQVREVMRDRDAGWSLEAAIDRVRGGHGIRDQSMFAGLRRTRPDLPVQDLSVRAMLAISQAIEDEYCAQAEAAVLLGAFQRVEFYEKARARCQELARTAALAVVFADFPRSRVQTNGPVEVALRADAPLLREWAVVCDAPGATACVAAVERPARRPFETGRRFEAIWSFEPEIVRDATELGLSLARTHAPRVARMIEHLPSRNTSRDAALQRAGALATRVVAYLDPDA